MNKLYASFLMVLLMSSAQAYEGESIVLDPATGNYIITYMGEEKLMQTTFVPATKIQPTVKSTLKLGKDFVVTYSYVVSNALSSPNPISGFLVDDVVNPIIGELPFPHEAMYQSGGVGKARFKVYEDAIKQNVATPGWMGDITRDAESNLKRVSWGALSSNPAYPGKPIQAGQSLSGFGFKSIDLPGVGESRLDGPSPIFGYPDDGPGEDSAIYDEIQRLRDNDWVVRPAAVPTISLPAVFDAAVVVERIREHVATWPGKQLADVTLAAQLDAEMVVVANAYRANQPEVARDHIEILLDLIRRDHKDLDHDDDEEHDEKHSDKEHSRQAKPVSIDRLAARILDFDLKYVLKRMKKDDGEHEKH